MGRIPLRTLLTVAVLIVSCIIGYTMIHSPVQTKPPEQKEMPEITTNAPEKKQIKEIDTPGTTPLAVSAPPPLAGTSKTKVTTEKIQNTQDISALVSSVRKLRNDPSQKTINQLKTFLDSREKVLVLSAINSLAIIGNNSIFKDAVVNILEKKAKDRYFPERGEALITASLLVKDNRIIPVIETFISEEDRSEGCLRSAASALAALATPECVTPLEQILEKSFSQEIHNRVFNTLSKINTPETLNILSHYLFSNNQEDQVFSAKALSQQNNIEYNDLLYQAISEKKLGQETLSVISRTQSGVEILGDLLTDTDYEKNDKLNALKILKKNIPLSTSDVREEIIKTVEPLLENEDPDLQMHALKIVGTGFGSETTADIISPKFESPNSTIRETALEAYLPYLNENNYKPVLEMILDKDEAVRRKALSLSFLYIDNSDRPLLEKALTHDDELIRNQVSQVLN
jgi:HEAT repeat protein